MTKKIKISYRQREFLEHLSSGWGSRVSNTNATAISLEKKGLISLTYSGLSANCALTENGLKALGKV